MEDVIGTAHEVWAVAQAGPKEGIADAVERIAPYLTQAAAAERAKVVAWLRSADPWHGLDPHTANCIANRLEALAHHEGEAG